MERRARRGRRYSFGDQPARILEIEFARILERKRRSAAVNLEKLPLRSRFKRLPRHIHLRHAPLSVRKRGVEGVDPELPTDRLLGLSSPPVGFRKGLPGHARTDLEGLRLRCLLWARLPSRLLRRLLRHLLRHRSALRKRSVPPRSPSTARPDPGLCPHHQPPRTMVHHPQTHASTTPNDRFTIHLRPRRRPIDEPIVRPPISHGRRAVGMERQPPPRPTREGKALPIGAVDGPGGRVLLEGVHPQSADQRDRGVVGIG